MEKKRLDPGEIPLVTVRNVSKNFTTKKVLSNIFFTIKKGEILGLIGQSGAGKTTLLELIIGFQKPDMGTILFRPEHLLLKENSITQYKPVTKQKKAVAKVFGFATQHPSFYPKLTVEENLKYFSNLYNIHKDIMKTNITTALELVGLQNERKAIAGSLSGGMEKRLDIACALVHDPQILILDEPTADLDVVLRRQMWHLIKRINSKGTTVIISSHFLQEMESLCDRVVIIHNKKIRAEGTVNDLKELFTKSEEIELEIANKSNYPKIARMLKKTNIPIERLGEREGKMVVYSPSGEQTLVHLIHIVDYLKETLIDIELNKPSLDEIFESIVEEKN